MNRYDDIINLPYPRPGQRPRMREADRAAQFSPFAALTGHDEAIAEAGRLTDEWVDLDAEILDGKLRILREFPGSQFTITYFQPDARKAGGAYLHRTGRVKKLDEHAGFIELADGTRIPFARIRDITEASEI